MYFPSIRTDPHASQTPVIQDGIVSYLHAGTHKGHSFTLGNLKGLLLKNRLIRIVQKTHLPILDICSKAGWQESGVS
jgi:hypothetical protein